MCMCMYMYIYKRVHFMRMVLLVLFVWSYVHVYIYTCASIYTCTVFRSTEHGICSLEQTNSTLYINTLHCAFCLLSPIRAHGFFASRQLCFSRNILWCMISGVHVLYDTVYVYCGLWSISTRMWIMSWAVHGYIGGGLCAHEMLSSVYAHWNQAV